MDTQNTSTKKMFTLFGDILRECKRIQVHVNLYH